jgi:hypothetical protein
MALKLKEGWVARNCHWGATRFHKTDANDWFGDAFAASPDDSGLWFAWPHGGKDEHTFQTQEEAHACLLNAGSESPWEEVPA